MVTKFGGSWAAVVTVVVLTGCAGAAGSEATESAPSAVVAARLDGTYDFDLDASDVARVHRARCASESGGDEAKSAACYGAVRVDAADEKIRFTKNAEGQLVFTSFAIAPQGEEVFLEAPITLRRGATDETMIARAAAFPRGSFVARIGFALHEMPLEAPDARTVVLVDPKKGRLVYHRAQ